MSLSDTARELIKDLNEIQRVADDLAPIESAVARKKEEYEAISQEVANLEEDVARLTEQAGASQAIIARSEARESAATVVLEDARRQAREVEDRASDSAAKIKREAFALKKEIEDEVTEKLERKRQLQKEIDELRVENSQIIAENRRLTEEREVLRFQRAELINRNASDRLL